MEAEKVSALDEARRVLQIGQLIASDLTQEDLIAFNAGNWAKQHQSKTDLTYTYHDRHLPEVILPYNEENKEKEAG